MTLTQSDIARAAGVSQYVVSHALRGSDRVAPATASRVRAVARRLGYRANAAAAATRTGRFRSMAVVGRPDLGGEMQLNLIKGVTRWAQAHDHSVVVGDLPYDKVLDLKVTPRFLRTHSVDGLIVHYAKDIPEHVVQALSAARLPVVWANVKQELDCVYPADFEAAQQFTLRLLEAGHRRILYAQPESDTQQRKYSERLHYSRGDRENGYAEAMRSNGLTPAILELPHSPRLVESVAAWKQVLLDEARPTAVLLTSPSDAVALPLAAAQLGMGTPGELTIGAILNHDMALAGPDVARLFVPFSDVGEAAAAMLSAKLLSGGQPHPSVPVPYRSLGLERIAPPPGI